MMTSEFHWGNPIFSLAISQTLTWLFSPSGLASLGSHEVWPRVSEALVNCRSWIGSMGCAYWNSQLTMLSYITCIDRHNRR